MEYTKQNKMGTMPIDKLLITMSVPMMISMLVQAFYNIVDSIFVAKISEDALTAVSLASPIQLLMIAFGAGTGVGVNALLSKALGEKNKELANKIGKNGIFLAVINYLAFLILGLLISKVYFESQTDNKIIIEYGMDYLSVVCSFSIGVFMQIMYERLLQSTGRTLLSMITQLLGAIVNIVLDPILIFGLCGFPKMGVKGAAIATVIGQIGAALLGFILNHFANPEINVRMKGFRPSWTLIKQIYKIGIPSIIMQAIGSIMTFCINKILIGFSTTATAVFGVYFKLQSFVFMPVIGMNNGMVPIIAFNYGAKNKERMMKTFKLALCLGVVMMSIGMIIFEVIPEKLFLLFEASDYMLSMGVPALRIIAIHFPVAAIVIIIGSMLQAIGKATDSMISSLCRQLLVLLPAAYLLSLLGDVNYVWFAFLFAEAAALTISGILFRRAYKRIIKPLGKSNTI